MTRITRRALGLLPIVALRAKAQGVKWSAGLVERPLEWFRSAEAREMARAVMAYQSSLGAWPKNTDLGVMPSRAELDKIDASGVANTIDNGATTTPMRFLARMVEATGGDEYKSAFGRGLDYLLAAQYANGGWPQFFPLRKGYYSHITYNDNAMVNVLTLLADLQGYEWVDAQKRKKAAEAVARGVECILKTQVKGKVWCAQHDENTLAPAWARKYEPPSLSGAESVNIVRYLMSIEEPSAEIISAVETAIAWIESVPVKGLRIDNSPGADGKKERRTVADPTAPPLLARFYELDTNRPIFLGRDSVFHYDFNEIERERRTGYNYLTPWPTSLLTKEYPHWRKRHKLAYRVLVSSDIGGTDPDDFQSMVHLLLCADVLDIEGIVSSPYGPGRREHILQVIDQYEKDFPHLKGYPTPAKLREIAKQGALESPGHAGVGAATEGSDWIVRCARRKDPRPLYVLVWGGLEDLAQALHDAPDILPKLRVYFIGGPNKMWSVDAYNYIETNHPKLWFIESNATYRGWFTGGNQTGEWSNTGFVTAHLAGHGALGDFFATKLKGTIKMGDSPSVGYLLHGTPEDPTQPGWGGRYRRIWDGRKTVFDRLTTEADQVEVFGVTEFALPVPAGVTGNVKVLLDNRVATAVVNDGKTLRFRFSPRDAKVWTYRIESGSVTLTGKFTAVPPPPERTAQASQIHPNWWIDDPDPAAAEGVHPGAKHVNRWREDFLRDFAGRAERLIATRP